ncbi:MAG TPA: Hsp20/alpha crystallin family protein [Vicinamibacterales bacterium]|nr:Hsp20/alpha crystallin family protein [Vicinamibacterales bacterium]
MALKKQTALAPRDPFTLFRQMTADLDRMFETSAFPPLRFPFFQTKPAAEANWFPEIDVFEKDNRLITKIDLPGLKKEDVKVELADGHLAISGERRSEAEEKKENFYRCEREYGSFYRAVPLPDGVKLEDVKATFADGVLEVSIPLPAKPEARVQTVAVQDAPKVTKTAA